jgi:hypothetical protein
MGLRWRHDRTLTLSSSATITRLDIDSAGTGRRDPVGSGDDDETSIITNSDTDIYSQRKVVEQDIYLYGTI